MAKKVVIDLEAKVDKAIDGVEKLNESVKDLKKDGVKAAEKLQDSVEDVGKSAKSSEKGISGLAKGFKGVGVAIKAAGIGLVIGALSTLKEVFESNQKVADLFSVAFETVSLVFNEFATAVIDTYESISKASDNFDALGKVISGVVTISLTPMKLAFYSIKLGIQQAQLAWEQSLFGGKDPDTIKRLTLDVLETKLALMEVAGEAVNAGKDIVTNVVEAVGEISNIATVAGNNLSKISISASLEAAKTNVKLKKSAELAAVANQGLIEKYDRQAEKLRQIRDDDTKGIAKRTKANEELNAVLDKQEKEMLKNANAILAAAQAEFDKNSNQENTIALMEAQNELAGVSAQIEGFRSEQLSNRVALEKESIELGLTENEAKVERQLAQKQFDEEQITGELMRLEQMRVNALEERRIQTELLTNKRNSYSKDTQAWQDANNELLTFKQDSANKETEIDKLIAKQKEDIIKNTLGAISGILGKESKAGKAVAIAQSLMNTYQGITAGVKLGFPAAIPAVLAAATTGFKAVKDIIKTKLPSGDVGGGSVPSASSVVQAVKTPSFNLVGTSGTNQLAGAIGSQSQQPIQTFVVSGDVTTAQSLERNIVEGASLG